METDSREPTSDATTSPPVQQRAENWERLEALVDRVQKRERPVEGLEHVSWVRRRLLGGLLPARGVQGLSAEEIGELGRLYRAAANRLAQQQTFGASTRRREQLNHLVARAHAVVYGRPQKRSARAFLLGNLLGFPVIVRRTWRFHVLAASLLALGGLYGYHGAASDREWAMNFVADERTPYADTATLRETLLVGREGHQQVSFLGKTGFAAFLWTHNTKVALLAFVSGLLLGIPPVLLLLYNGALLGVYSATFSRHGLDSEWWAWILPHGVTELLGIVLLSGGGLFIGWTVLVPGYRSRASALARRRGDMFHILVFSFPMFLFAALIESFVRQSNLSVPGRYGFAAASAVFWFVYLGFVRPTDAFRRRHELGATLAEVRVPLPEHEELAAAFGSGRRRA